MNQSFLYLISEELYKRASSNTLCNRNWLFSIYKSLLVSNGINTEPIIWTKYNQWKIDHNCRAAKSTVKSDGTVSTNFSLIKVDEDNYEIAATFLKKDKTVAVKCNYTKKGFPIGLWEDPNPMGQTVLSSKHERDQLFESSINEDNADDINFMKD